MHMCEHAGIPGPSEGRECSGASKGFHEGSQVGSCEKQSFLSWI